MGHTDNHPLELKSRAEIEKMRRAARILQRVILEVVNTAEVGLTTLELDRLAHSRIKEAGARPAFLNMYGFPKTLCISINEEVVHGIPNKKRTLEDGDIVSIDCGVWLDGFFADTAYTVGVGRVDPKAQRLMEVTQRSLDLAIGQCLPGNRLGDIGAAVQECVEGAGFAVIKGYTGHGIGRNLHEKPKVENQGRAGRGERLRPGMVLAIEPMVAMGAGDTEELEDGWTVVTRDRSLAAHFEHTIAILEDGPEILTRSE